MKKYLIFTLLLIVFSCKQENKHENKHEKIMFNQVEWLNGDWRTRGKMADNIIEDSILIGKSKMEVISLLGDQGDTTDNFSYQVDIGLKSGPFGVNGVWLFYLNIHFDSITNKVVEITCND